MIRVGRSGRVIGATYTTDRTHVEYFDPDYKALHATLVRALPKLPLIDFVSASGDEQILLIHGSSDIDPGTLVCLRPHAQGARRGDHVPAGPQRQTTLARQIHHVCRRRRHADSRVPHVASRRHRREEPARHRDAARRSGIARRMGLRLAVAVFRATRLRGAAAQLTAGRPATATPGSTTTDSAAGRLPIGDVCDAGRWLISQGMADPAETRGVRLVLWRLCRTCRPTCWTPISSRRWSRSRPCPISRCSRTNRMIYTNAFVIADYSAAARTSRKDRRRRMRRPSSRRCSCSTAPKT